MAPLRILACLAATAAACAADSFSVVAVPAPDRVVIQYHGLPIALPLAHLDLPEDPAARQACRARLDQLVSGKRVELLFAPGFPSDADGGACIQLVVGRTNVNAELIERGLARYRPGSTPGAGFESPLKRAQDQAQKAGVGLWAKPATSAAATTSLPTPPAPPARPKTAKSGAFCAELDNRYYWPSGDAAVARVDPQRLVFYADEATARRAGKVRAPAEEEIACDGSEAAADRVFAQGEQLYTQAIAAGNTPERDQLYERACRYLTRAQQAYGDLVEKRGDDQALGEKLRRCSQLRYGSIKQRRFTH